MRPCVLAAAAFLVSLPCAHADELRLREVFERTASAPPVRYALGRDVLFANGARAARLAVAYRNDADPRKRALAQLIRLRHARPGQFKAWAAALQAPWVHVSRSTAVGARTVVRFPRLGPKGQQLEMREMQFGPGSEWILIDSLLAGHGAHHAARIAGSMRAEAAVPFLAMHLGRRSESKRYEHALVAIGPAAAPAVRELLGKRGGAAARVLGRLSDKKSTDRLLALVVETDDEATLAAVAGALQTLAPRRAATKLLDRLLRGDAKIHYGVLREALLAYATALPAAIKRRREGATIPHIAILDGLAWEGDHPARATAAYITMERYAKAMRHYEIAELGREEFWWRGAPGPMPLVRERAAAFGGAEDVLRVLAHDRAVGAELAKAALLGSLRRGYGADVFWALAAHAPATALDVAGSALTDVPPPDVERYIEALLLLVGEPQTRTLLEGVVERANAPRYAKAIPVARAALSVVRKERTLADLLTHDREGIALAAARTLARRGNSKGVPVLASAAVRAREFAYTSLRDDLVRAGKTDKAAAKDAHDDLFLSVMRRAVAFRIANPKRAQEIDEAIVRARPQVFHILGAQQGDFAIAGELLAKELGADARPLLEEAALFVGERVAIHAVGSLADASSIPVLLRVARTSPRDASTALRAMGEAGLAAARKVPMPDPQKADYRGRGWRHASAAEALLGQDGGLEKLLQGLSEPRPEKKPDGWIRRTTDYVRVASRAMSRATADPRFLDPTLRLLAAHGAESDRLRDSCLDLLAHFCDERVARAALAWLPSDHAYRALQASLGDDATEFVKARVREASPPSFALLYTLWRLAMAPAAKRADRDFCAKLLREACVAEASTAPRAAHDLLRLHESRPQVERDDRDRLAVLQFVASHGEPGPVASAVAEANWPGAGEALLKCYRIAGDSRARYGLGRLQYEPAVPDVAAAARRFVESKKQRPWASPFSTLALLGKTGRRMTHAYLAKQYDVKIRIMAAQALAAAKDQSAFDAIVALLDEREPIEAARKQVETLAWALARADSNRAYTEFVRRALAAPKRLRDFYAGVAAGIRDKDPSGARVFPAVQDD